MRDPILEEMVKFAEWGEPLELDVTLVIAGFLVSGFIISKQKYLQHNVVTQKLDEGNKKAMAELGEEVPADDGKRRYIHLRNAQFFVPGQIPIPANGQATCRLKLSSVTGFHFGLLASATPE